MFWTIFATFVATSLIWLVFIMFAINWAQNLELKKLKGTPKEESHE